MVTGTASKKVTVTLPPEQVEQIKQLVEAGQEQSVSRFVQHAVGVSLEDVASWRATLTQALDETGGPITDDEREWADAVLDPSVQIIEV